MNKKLDKLGVECHMTYPGNVDKQFHDQIVFLVQKHIKLMIKTLQNIGGTWRLALLRLRASSRLLVAFASGCLFAGAFMHSAAALTFDVAQFGALGDCIHDDGPAIRKAIAAAVQTSGDAEVVFAKKNYRLGEFPDHDFQFELNHVSGLTINGVVRNFELDYDPLPFTQGTISAINAGQRTIAVQIQQGYPLPPADELIKKYYGAKGWDWGVVIDPVERHRRWDVRDHWYVDSVNPLPRTERTFQIVIDEAYAEALKLVRTGDRFFLPLRYGDSRTGAHSEGGNVVVRGSTDCILENITLFSARSGMDFAIIGNEGRITLRGIKITYKPGSDRVVTTWKDGMHCKDNKLGPIIENCLFEGMTDDSINIGANTFMAAKVLSSSEFQLTSWAEFQLNGSPFHEGDAVMVFDPQSGRVLAETKVAALRVKDNQNTVVLGQPVPGVVAGENRRNIDSRATHFYNMTYCGSGYVIRSCTFGPQRRRALLLRAPWGVIEGNTMDSVGESAIYLGNELGSFYEGPFPCHTVVSNNVIRNPQGPAIVIATESLSKINQQILDIRVINNRLTLLPQKSGIIVRKARDILLQGNQIRDGAGHDLGTKAIQVIDSTNVSIN